MSNGTLYQLVSQYGANVVGRECLYDKAIGVDIIDITNSLNSFTLERWSDIINIDKLIFEFNEETNINNIIEELKNNASPIVFIVKADVNKIIELDLNFLIDLNIESNELNVNERSNKLTINLRINNFISELKMIALQHSNVVISLLNIGQQLLNLIRSVKITLKLTYLGREPRRRMAQQGHEENIQQISSININSNSEQLIFRNRLKLDGYSKGFFIRGNINELKYIKLILQDQETINYDDDLIDLYCHKVSNNLIYIPFNPNLLTSYTTNTIDSFIGGINFSRLNYIKIETEWSQPQNSFKLYFYTLNILRIISGMCGFAYTENPIIDLDYNNHQISSSNQIIFTTKYKIIDQNKIICPISLEKINQNDHYMLCNTCKNCFLETEIKKWFDIKKCCPLCKINWTNNIIYINSELTNDVIVEQTNEQINEPINETNIEVLNV